jgi:hypothetical protein
VSVIDNRTARQFQDVWFGSEADLKARLSVDFLLDFVINVPSGPASVSAPFS